LNWHYKNQAQAGLQSVPLKMLSSSI